MNKRIKIFFLLSLIVLIFLIQFTYKKVRNGNNIDISKQDLIEYILNISSYEAEIEVTIYSNKTTNKYELKQYYASPESFKQIVLCPENIKGIETIYNEKKLVIKNTNLGLSKIYQNFKNINNSDLWLSAFLENCKQTKYYIKDTDREIIIENGKNHRLYISKEEKRPTKLEIMDNNKNIKAYIEYKEIKVNNIEKNDIFAFTTKDIKIEL